MQPSTPPISVDWAKEIAYFRAAFLKVEPRFDPKLADRNILNSLFAWVWKLDEYNKLKLDYNKGFCFYGDLGLGKSMTLQALRQYRNGLVSRYESKKEDFRMKDTEARSFHQTQAPERTQSVVRRTFYMWSVRAAYTR